MQPFITKIFQTLAQHVLGLTLYDMIQASQDFQDVSTALNERIDWSIDFFRNCFTIHLTSGNYFLMLCILSFLVMAENMRIHYGRLSPAELKEHVELVGYASFAILLGVLDVGFVVVPITGFIALFGSPVLATTLVLISMSPSIILPILPYLARLIKQRRPESTSEDEVEAGTVDDGDSGK